MQDVKMVQWHSSMDILYSCIYDNTVKAWAEDGDGNDWHCIQTLAESNNGNSSTIWTLYFNSEGDKMATCSADLTVKIWDTDNEQQFGDFAPWNNIVDSGAGDDAIRLFVEDKEVDAPSYKLLLEKEKAHDMDVNAVQWSLGDKELLAFASDDETIKIWKLAHAH